MNSIIGIRREDKNQWERRVPLTPTHIQELRDKHNITTVIQPSKIRIFSDKNYQQHGAKIMEDISKASVIFAVKEIPNSFFENNKTYVFFSHTIKGQSSNMPMLKKMMDLSCTLIDYERIVDPQGRRLVFFGRHAGLAGMIDTLWGFGQRFKNLGIDSPLSQIKQTIDYQTLDDVKVDLHKIGNTIQKNGLPSEIAPLVVGFAGYGHVSEGAQEILDVLPIKEATPEKLSGISEDYSNKFIYKVVFKEEHMVRPKISDDGFNLQEYYNHPDRYKPKFQQYLSFLTILMNCVYWDDRYPRLVTKQWLKRVDKNTCRLQAIGDISVDINGAIEFTEKVTTPNSPCFVYNPKNNTISDGVNGEGIMIMAIDNLPCELPLESSKSFSDALVDLVPTIVNTDFSQSFSQLNLPVALQHAVILHKGQLTPEYEYIDKYL